MAKQPPAPIIGWQDFQRLVHEYAAAARCAELATIIIQIIERLDVIDQFPRFIRSQDCGGERQGMERYVILAHELGIGHVIRAFVRAPPPFPIVAFARVDPFLGAGDIFDWGVEPDIENLALHPWPIGIALFHRDTPVQIARDATVLQSIPIVEPFFRNGCRQDGPIRFAVDPCLKPIFHRGLA